MYYEILLPPAMYGLLNRQKSDDLASGKFKKRRQQQEAPMASRATSRRACRKL